MRDIYVARHGEDLDNAGGVFNGRRDTPLTPKGRLQARELAENLKKHPNIDIGWIFCSPLKRARETARIVAYKLITRYSVVDELIEMNYGILEGRPISDVPRLAKSWTGSEDKFWYILDVEGGESYSELYLRTEIGLPQIRQKAEKLKIPNDILIISHGTVIKALDVVHKGLPWERIFETGFLGNCQFKKLE